MPFFVCAVPVCPVRAEAAHRSEQVSQLLFGELCEALEWSKEFVKIKVLYDDYEGWCQVTQLEEINETTDLDREKQFAADWVNKITVNGVVMPVPFGSSLPALNNEKREIGKLNIEYTGPVIEPLKNNFSEEAVKKVSYNFINTPYLWGGRSVFGVDCSGFTQVVFACMNIKLQRDAYQQATQGEAVGFLQEVKCGDLAFFDNEAGKITHVGILLDSNTIIHASGKVRVDTMDNAGIVNRDTKKRTHNLRIIKRIADY